jgi:hypothetical protein
LTGLTGGTLSAQDVNVVPFKINMIKLEIVDSFFVKKCFFLNKKCFLRTKKLFGFLGSESSVLFATEAVTQATIIRLVHYSSTTIRLVSFL